MNLPNRNSKSDFAVCGSGAIWIDPCIDGDKHLLRVRLFLKQPGPVRICGFSFDLERNELTEGGEPLHRPADVVTMKQLSKSEMGKVEARVITGLGTETIYVGYATLEIPEDVRRRSHYFSITVSPTQRPGAPHDRHVDDIDMHIERPNHLIGLGLGPVSAFGWLLTEFECHQRIEELAFWDGLAVRDEPWATLALEKRMSSVRGGRDTVLLARELDDFAEDVDRICGVQLKYSILETYRRQQTRQGLASIKRVVEDIDPNDIPNPEDDEEPELTDVDRKRQIVDGFIREFTTDVKKQRLIWKHLIFGQRLEPLSTRLGFHYPTARSIVSRFKKFLFPPI